ncbi:carbohydrate kinase [Microbacterium sp. NPDC077184]|uniref:class I mannose-6-phosphate isomerase n=1 Tax=Microbacterium sp. NPDC077184 TaxID=3154764 RepID=UPI003449E8FE
MIVALAANRPPARFYRGGARIARFRGETDAASHEPEDWVGSVTTVAGHDTDGLTRLPDGRFLRDAIAADPEHWLGARHVARWGADPQLLVKLLDAGQRLPVHAHPSDAFAHTHLGRTHGKAEAWYILEGGAVYVGLREDVDPVALARLVAAQDADALLGLLHAIEVSPGDVVWVPPGELHAIGAGVFLLELQQPEDLSILLEWDGFALDGARDGHLGLGFDVALRAVNHRARTPAEIGALVRPAPASGSVFPAAADAFFRLERHRLGDGRTDAATLEAGFAIVIVTAGRAELAGVDAAAGATLLIPAAADAIPVRGSGEILVARPPHA